MQPILDFIINNPEVMAIIFIALESVLLPFIPVKWNGVANLILKLIKAKLIKAKVLKEAEVKPIENEAKTKMEQAVKESGNPSIADKLRD